MGKRAGQWAKLLKRVFDIDVLQCSKCRGRSKIIAAARAPKGNDSEFKNKFVYVGRACPQIKFPIHHDENYSDIYFILHFPMHFKVTSHSSFGIQSSWNSGASSTNLTLTIPPEFQGPGGGFSPEDLYAMASLNCFIATFKVVAEKSKLEFKRIGRTKPM